MQCGAVCCEPVCAPFTQSNQVIDKDGHGIHEKKENNTIKFYKKNRN